MGIGKMAKSLNCSVEQAKVITGKYDKALPYLRTLMTQCSTTIKRRGYIKTILGRRLYNDKPIYDKKLNKEEQKLVKEYLKGKIFKDLMPAKNDYVDSKVTKLYFDSNATHQDEESCEGVANITHSLHSDATTQKMLSIALSGYMAGKKVRAYSKSSGSCEVELISLQEAYF